MCIDDPPRRTSRDLVDLYSPFCAITTCHKANSTVTMDYTRMPEERAACCGWTVNWKIKESQFDSRQGRLLTYLLTPWCRVLLQKLTGLQLVKKFPAFHATQRFITALTSVRHLSLSWASPIQSIYPHPTSWRSVLILSTHLRLGLPSRLFPSGFPTKTLYTPLSSPISATCPTHLILLDFITRTLLGEEYKSFSSSLCNLLHSLVTSSLLGPNILLNTMLTTGWTVRDRISVGTRFSARPDRPWGPPSLL